MSRPKISEEDLRNAVERARQRYATASDKFSEVVTAIPSGLPHSDGVRRIEIVANERRLAIRDLSEAVKNWTEFLTKGIFPAEGEIDSLRSEDPAKD